MTATIETSFANMNPPQSLAPRAAVVPLTDLYPSPSNPRKHFHGLQELAESIAQKNIQIPLVVRERETAQGRYEVVDGERRYRAAQQAGLQFVPVLLRHGITDAEVLELQLENAMQRNDLTPLEEARGIQALLKAGKSTPAEIARSLSRSERFVADRLRLLTLVPELQSLLDQQRIGVAHADLLSKLKPEDQQRAAAPGDRRQWGRAGDPGGLWSHVGRTLDFEDEDDDNAAATADPYAGLKPVTPKELAAWVATNVRFDVAHAAQTAPLEFGRVEGQVATAAAQPGRGRKVIHITHEYHLADTVKDPAQRVYGPKSWKRADDTVASVRDGRGQWVDAKPCAHSVLGLVVAGQEYGTAFQVCIAREVCEVHWKAEIREKKAREKLRASGQGDKATAREQQQRTKEANERERREQERKATNVAYRQAYPAMAEALLAAAPAANSPEGLALLWWACEMSGGVPKGVTTADQLVAAVLRDLVEQRAPRGKGDDGWTGYDYEVRQLTDVSKLLGIQKTVDGLLAAARTAATAAAQLPKTEKPKAAKKAPARGKAVKRR